MQSKYHAIEDGLWDDPKFDADVLLNLPEADGDERGFFAFLCSNKMQRPCGIYRATNVELAVMYRWPLARVEATLPILVRRRLIVRDGSWIFMPGYWKRQAHNPGMIKAARAGIESCSSPIIIDAFLEHYPLHKEWLGNGSETVCQPSNRIASTDQTSTRADQSRPEEGSDHATQSSESTHDALDPELRKVLRECPHLKLVSNGESGEFWDQVLGACEPYPLADGRWLGARLRKWNQYFVARPHRRSRERKYLEARLMEWLVQDLEALARKRA